VGDLGAFLCAPRHQGVGKGRFCNPVAAAHGVGQEPAGQLVLTLCARFEAGQAFAQTIGDALVITGLEVQSGQGGPAPVAAVQRICATQAQRTGHRLAVGQGQEDHQRARHRAGEMLQERQRQCGRVAVLGEGLQVEAVHGAQVGFGGLIPVHDAIRDAAAGELGALLADVLAVLVIHRAEEVVEGVPATGVVPLELDVLAQQPVRAEGRVFVGGMEVDVRRGPAQARHFARQPCQQGAPVFGRARKHAGAGHRRVRHRAQPLGEVVQSVLGIGVGPGVIEHELAVRIVLEVAGDCRHQGVALPQCEVARSPAPLRAQATVFFKAGEEGVRQERVASVVQGVPGSGGDIGETVQETWIGHGQRIEQPGWAQRAGTVPPSKKAGE